MQAVNRLKMVMWKSPATKGLNRVLVWFRRLFAAVFLQVNTGIEVADMIVDIWVAEGRKVLSIETHGSQHRLITMIPGTWESSFGSPRVPWPPAIQQKLAQSLARVQALKSSVLRLFTHKLAFKNPASIFNRMELYLMC